MQQSQAYTHSVGIQDLSGPLHIRNITELIPTSLGALTVVKLTSERVFRILCRCCFGTRAQAQHTPRGKQPL